MFNFYSLSPMFFECVCLALSLLMFQRKRFFYQNAKNKMLKNKLTASVPYFCMFFKTPKY